MSNKEQFEELTSQIEGAVRDLTVQSPLERKETKDLIENLLTELRSLIRSHPNRMEFGSRYSDYFGRIEDDLKALCKPGTTGYRGDEFHKVQIFSSLKNLGSPVCLNVESWD